MWRPGPLYHEPAGQRSHIPCAHLPPLLGTRGRRMPAGRPKAFVNSPGPPRSVVDQVSPSGRQVWPASAFPNDQLCLLCRNPLFPPSGRWFPKRQRPGWAASPPRSVVHSRGDCVWPGQQARLPRGAPAGRGAPGPLRGHRLLRPLSSGGAQVRAVCAQGSSGPLPVSHGVCQHSWDLRQR